MAQAKPQSDTLTDTLSDEFLQCPLCFEQFANPKVLPCQHTFCLECLRRYVAVRTFYEYLPCPLCKESFEVPGNNVENFRNNFMIVSLLQLVEKSKTASKEAKADQSTFSMFSLSNTNPNQEKQCGACEESGRLANYCNVCYMWLCAVCSKAHRKVPLTASHVLVSNEEVNQECKKVGDQGEKKIMEMQNETIEAEDFFLGQIRQLPENIEATKSKIKASAEEAMNVIKEKSENLMEAVDTFYTQREFEVFDKLHKAEERKKNLDKTLELLNAVKISTDGPYNQLAIKSVEDFISCHKDSFEVDISKDSSVHLAFTGCKSSINEVKGYELGCLRKVTNNVMNVYLHDRLLSVHKEACLIEREYISGLAINKLAHKFMVANNKSVLVLKYNSKVPQNFLSPLSERCVTRPWGIAYSVEDSRVFISEAGTHEGEGAVISYNHDGAFHSVVASGLTLPRGISIHKNMVFVCDQIDRCVYIMNVWGKIIRVLKKTPDGQFLFSGPMFISVGRSGTFAVSDNFTSVKIFDKDCKHLFTYTSEISDTEFWDVLVLQNDNVVVCDWKHGLHKISTDLVSNGLISVDPSDLMKEPAALASLYNGNSIYIGTCGGEIFSAI